MGNGTTYGKIVVILGMADGIGPTTVYCILIADLLVSFSS